MDQVVRKFPVAEIFEAPQGEGLWAGTLSLFVRFAGCTVGKVMTKDEREHFQVLNTYQEKCTAWDNTEFACDTNYKATEFFTEQELFDKIRENPITRIVFTGGEPLMHTQLRYLVAKLRVAGKSIQIETSGTISLVALIHAPLSLESVSSHIGNLYITISPKKNYLLDNLLWADELKILVDENFSVVTFEEHFGKVISKPFGPIVYIQAINNEHTFNMVNLQKCLEIQKQFPTVRISTQLQKLYKTR